MTSLPALQSRPSNVSYKELPARPSERGMVMASGAAYASVPTNTFEHVPSESYWPHHPSNGPGLEMLAAQQAKRTRNRRLLIGGMAIGAVALIAIIAGVVVSQVNKNKSSGDANDAAKDSNSGGILSNPNDPSKFTKDPNLHQVFWGFAYTPSGTQLPGCGATQANITRDIQLLSQLTTRLHLYGANCNTTALVLQAIQDTKVNMTVWPGIYVDSDTTAYNNQLAAIKSALQTYGTDNIAGITVGNEYILDTAGSSSNVSSTYLSAVDTLTSDISSVRSTIDGLGLKKTIPVGTADAGSIMSTTLAEGIDYYMANVHPWFGGLAIDDAAVWTWEFFNSFDVAVAATASNSPASYIAETGWPTGSMNVSEATDGAGSPQGDASVANLQIFLDTFVCQANANGTGYFYFEAFDEPWKEIYGGVEPYWGLFDSDRNLKNLTIPTC